MSHPISRGDQRDDIFLDDVDRHDFLQTQPKADHSAADEPARLKWTENDRAARQRPIA